MITGFMSFLEVLVFCNIHIIFELMYNDSGILSQIKNKKYQYSDLKTKLEEGIGIANNSLKHKSLRRTDKFKNKENI